MTTSALLAPAPRLRSVALRLADKLPVVYSSSLRQDDPGKYQALAPRSAQANFYSFHPEHLPIEEIHK
jgi:hypothetical protein